MKKYRGGLEGIVATVIIVTLVILVIVTSIIELSQQSGQTINQSVTGIVDAQYNIQVSKEN